MIVGELEGFRIYVDDMSSTKVQNNVLYIYMNTEITSFLKNRNLTETEIKLYLLGLQEGSLGASELAKQSGIRRTTVYSALSALEQKGFASVNESEQKRQYTMSNPLMIEHQIAQEVDSLQEQKKDFAEVLPLFDGLVAGTGVGSSVQQFVGEQGVRTAIDQALFCANRSWKIIAPAENYFSQSDAEYAKYFIKTRKQRGITAQSLWEPVFAKSRKFSQGTIDTRNPRILAKEYEGKFASVVILFDQKVLFVNSVKDFSAVVISSPEIFSTMEVFFNGVWSVSKSVPQKYIKPEV